MTTKIEPGAKAQEVVTEVKLTLDKYAQELDVMVILAIMSHIVGGLIAIQDQTKYTSEQIMDMVGKNIETGNAEMIESIFAGTGQMQ